MNKMTFEFTLDEVNLILAGLSELPAKQSISLLLKLQEEASIKVKNFEKEKLEKGEKEKSNLPPQIEG